jgi:phage terminase small subunit
MAKGKKTIAPKKKPKKAPKRVTKKPESVALRHSAFVDAYVTNGFNASDAAKKAGTKAKNTRQAGYELLTNPDVRKEIDKKLEQMSLGKQETVKLLSDIAQGSLNDYFVTTTKVEKPQVHAPLKQLIKELQARIEDQQKLIERAKINNADTLKAMNGQADYWRLEIIQYEIELERNPKAYRIVAAESRLVETVELDLAKLVKDKERGKIKSITPNEHGLKIEMYAADAALRDIGRYHGIFEKDKEPPPPINFNFNNLSSNELKTLAALKQKAVK